MSNLKVTCLYICWFRTLFNNNSITVCIYNNHYYKIKNILKLIFKLISKLLAYILEKL